MKPAPFEYLSPSTLEDVLDILNQRGPDAKLLAGGQSLIPVMNFRLAQPALLVDMNRVSGLSRLLPTSSGGLQVGAMVRHSQLEHSEAVATLAPLMHETMPHIAHPQIRNRGTIGGSLAHADPAAELPVIMVALQAQFRLRRRGGERWVNAEDFFQSLFTTALEADEIVVEIAIPPLPRHTGCAFLELARRHGDYAQAGVAAVIQLDEAGYCRQARLVYLNAGEIPMVAARAASAMVGHIPTANLITDLALSAARNEIDPTGDIHATAEYRRHLAFVLGKRAMQQAVARAQKGLQI